jgi:hypothetical protein
MGERQDQRRRRECGQMGSPRRAQAESVLLRKRRPWREKADTIDAGLGGKGISRRRG